jgi:Uma2 family endonuclease
MPEAIIKKRFTADEYQRMGETGILGPEDRVELIDGEVLTMTPIGPRHSACVSRATHAFVKAVGDDAIVLPQGSVRLDRYNEPEPDLALLRPRADFYASRHAGPDDILLVIEIAASSIAYDRDLKARIYAEAGVVEYWIADLNDNVVLRYSSPERGRYARVERCHRGQSIAPILLPTCAIDVDVLLTE